MLDVISLQGKANRSDWWLTIIVGGIVAQLAFIFAFISRLEESSSSWLVFIGLFILGLIATWSIIAVTARRFRDLGQSPWLTFLYLVPVLGEIYIFIACGFLPLSKIGGRKVVVRQVSNRK